MAAVDFQKSLLIIALYGYDYNYNKGGDLPTVPIRR